MSMPQATMDEIQAAAPNDIIPANQNALRVVALSDVQSGFEIVESKLAGLKGVSVANLLTAINEFHGAVTNIKELITAAAFEAVKRPDEKMEIIGAPAIIINRSGDYKPGEWVEDKAGIFIKSIDDLWDVKGSNLGRKLDWFDAATDLGDPKTFNDTVGAVAKVDINNRGGLKLDPARYEAELFEGLRTGEALGKHVIAPLEVLRTIYALRNEGEYKRRSEENSPGKLITKASGHGNAHWQWSCTPNRNHPDGVRVVVFTDGVDDWHRRDGIRLSGRACFAELKL